MILLVNSWKNRMEGLPVFCQHFHLLCLPVCYVTAGENRSRKQEERSAVAESLQIIHGQNIHLLTAPTGDDLHHPRVNRIYPHACRCETAVWFAPFHVQPKILQLLLLSDPCIMKQILWWHRLRCSLVYVCKKDFFYLRTKPSIPICFKLALLGEVCLSFLSCVQFSNLFQMHRTKLKAAVCYISYNSCFDHFVTWLLCVPYVCCFSPTHRDLPREPTATQWLKLCSTSMRVMYQYKHWALTERACGTLREKSQTPHRWLWFPVKFLQ